MKPKSKLVAAEEAMQIIQDGDRILVGGFGQKGTPDYLIDALVDSGRKELTVISNDLGSPGKGLGRLLENGMIKALIGNYYTWNPKVAEAYTAGEIEVTLIPQGTFAEAIRAGGHGIPAFYTEVGVGTLLAEGKEHREVNGITYILERALTADIALIQAHKADGLGNLVYQRVARNFNPAMAMASKHCIVQVSEVVDSGALCPEEIVTPHVFIDRVVLTPERS
ncbi:MAG: CoA transferase subunit A [Brooklawnia sp.]|jgi:3-oxoacid CoA-transferase A subunit